MKHSIFASICLLAVAAFAGPYNIEEFTAQDAGAPDDVITAEFGGELTTVPVDEVATLQEGRLVVRQKFVDPFGESESTYQLYQGSAGNLSSMTALSAPEGTDYGTLVKTKFYARRGMQPNEDVEKVYFDGKSVYVPNQTTVIAFIDGTPVELKNPDAAPAEPEPVAAAETSSSSEEECGEYDDDCEEEDDDVAVNNNVDYSNDDTRDYAASEASEAATDRFGIADEVRFWSAVGLAAVAVGGAIMGIVQHMKSNDAKAAYDDLSDLNDTLLGEVSKACNGDAACEVAMIQKADLDGSGYTIATLQDRMDTNKKTRDSYATARNIWFGVTGVALTAAIVLYVW